MKVILRKNDSATSLLLFIYNNYKVRTGKDSMRLLSLLEILKVFGKSETAIRMSLSRAVKSGLLINSKSENDIIYTLTPEGKKSIILWNEGVMYFWKRYQLRNSAWNSMWYFINVEFTDENKENKTEFFDELQQRGFALLNTNTWITPYHQKEDLWELIEKYDLKDGVTEIYGDMKVHKNMDKFLDETFGIKKLNSAYHKFADDYGNKLTEIRQLFRENAYIEKGLALPILNELGWNYFKIASEDPVLPKQILPQWEGDRAARIMQEMREMLIEAANKYLERFD